MSYTTTQHLFLLGVLLVFSEAVWSSRSSALSRRLRKVKAKAKDDGEPLCGCDCCDVVPRLPDEVVSGVAIKCSTSSKHDPQVCPSECRTQVGDRVFQSAQPGEVVDYLRFCFYECKPADGRKTPLDSQCTALEPSDVDRLLDKSGNAQDPAVLLIPPPPAPKKKKAAFLKENATLTSKTGNPDAARAAANRGMKQAAFEGHEARNVAETVRTGQEERAARISNVLGAPNPYAAVADIHEAMLQSMKSANAAGEAAQEAAAAVEDARAGDWAASITEGQGAIGTALGQQQAADAAAAAALAAVTNGPDIKAANAAQKAAMPFVLSMWRAQQSVKDFEGKAGAQAAKARGLEKKARGLEKKANAQNAAGQAATAQATITQAREVMKQAQEFAAQAHQMYAVAEEINKGIPKYQGAAKAAAARAAWASNPAWNPGATR